MEGAPFNHTNVQKNYFHESGCSWVSWTPHTHIRLSLSSLASKGKFLLLGTGCLGGSAITTFLQISTSPGQWLFLGVLEDPPKRPFGELSARNPPDDLGQLFPQAPEFTSTEATMQWTMTKHWIVLCTLQQKTAKFKSWTAKIWDVTSYLHYTSVSICKTWIVK